MLALNDMRVQECLGLMESATLTANPNRAGHTTQQHGRAREKPGYDRTAASTTVAILFLLVLLSFGGMAIDRLRRAGVGAAPFVVAIGAAVTAAPLIVAAHLAANSTTAYMLLSAGLLLFGSIAAVSYASNQAIAPPDDRGMLAALVVIVCAIVAQGIAPVAVALVTDFVFHSEARIGSSLAIVIGAFSTIGALSFATGVRPLRRVSKLR